MKLNHWDLSLFEEQAQKYYDMIPESDSTVHHVFTTDRAFSKGRLYLNKRKENVVLLNWEECVRLVYQYGFTAKRLTFISDADWKSELLTSYLPDVKIVKYNETNFMTYQKKFHGGSINPAFGLSLELRSIAEKLVTSKLLMVSPTRDFENPALLKNVVYYKALGDTAFDEQVMTSLCVIDTIGDITNCVVEGKDGNTIKVTDIPFAPGDNLDDWLYAVKVLNLGLPSYKCQYGQVSLVKNSPSEYQFKGTKHSIPGKGIPLIFNPGELDDPNFGKVVEIQTIHQDQATGYGKEMLIVAKNGMIGKIKTIKIKPKKYGHGHNTVSLTNIDESELQEALDYLNSPEVARLIRGVKTNTIVNGVNLWSKIPHHKYKDKWISKV